jgi:hypothetical protein
MSDSFDLNKIPEFHRFQAANPHNVIDEEAAIMMYGRAIHWASILKIISPDFENEDYYSVDVIYLAYHDPDRAQIPEEFYKYMEKKLYELWTLQLEKLYPHGDWTVKIWGNSERSVDVTIRRRK